MPLVRAPSLAQILSCTHQLTAADILALNTTPVAVVPSPGVGKIIAVLGMAFVFSEGTSPYSSTHTDKFSGTYAGSDNDNVVPDVMGLITAGASGFDYESGSCQAPADIMPGNDGQGIQVGFAGGYLGGSILTSTLDAGGLGYAVDDTGTITTGNGDATYKVLTVDGMGAVLTYQITAAGSAYSTGAGQATSPGGGQPGIGAGFSVNVTAIQQGNGTLKVVTYYQIIDVP